MDSKEDTQKAMDALREHVEQTAQNAIQIINDYVYMSEYLSLESVQELKYSKRIFTVILSNPAKSKPLSIISLFDFSEDCVEKVLHQISIIFTACGFEIKKSDSSYIFNESDSEKILSLHNFMSNNIEISIFSEYDSQKENNECSLFLSALGEKIEIISIDSSSSKNIGVLEHQLSLFFAAIGKTVKISDGSVINNYGCVVSPVDVNESE